MNLLKKEPKKLFQRGSNSVAGRVSLPDLLGISQGFDEAVLSGSLRYSVEDVVDSSLALDAGE
jgi:hypothetical protein